MPIFDYECPMCGTIENVAAKIADVDISCPRCGISSAHRLFSPPTHIICDIEPYFDVNLGKGGGTFVTSRQHKKSLLKREGLEIKG